MLQDDVFWFGCLLSSLCWSGQHNLEWELSGY